MEFENGFVESLREPDNSLASKNRCPFDGGWRVASAGPRALNPAELRGSRLIHHNNGVGVGLKVTGRDAGGGLRLHHLGDNAGLALRESHHHDILCRHDARDTHGNRLLGDMLDAKEVTGSIDTGDTVKVNNTGTAVLSRARFVEADVAGLADAEELEVEAAVGQDELVIVEAVLLGQLVRHRPVRDVDVGRRDVDVLEKVLVHEPAALLGENRGHK